MARTHLLLMTLAFTTVIACSGANAWDQNPFEQYLQRSDTVTLGAGDAKETNTVTHVIDPWPPYVGDRHIPGHGERMSGAVERYRDVGKLRGAPRPIVPIFDAQGTSGGGGSGGGGGGGGR